MNIVIGSRGRLGRALLASLPPDQVIAPERDVYATWWRDDATDAINDYLANQPFGRGTIYVVAGIIDPRCAADDHDRINFRLARNVLERGAELGFRVVTFGTIMEELVGGRTANPYVVSKKRLGDYVSARTNRPDMALHLRIHTLYGGGPPNPFMFLGQILTAIKNRERFEMTPGEQLREYHHIEDEATAIIQLAATGLHGATNLSHGAPLTLRAVAQYVFKQFGCLDRLAVGALPAPPIENYDARMARLPHLANLEFREALPAIYEYLHDIVSTMGNAK